MSNNNPANPATASLDAHDIANRIMREENYLIALFNKDLLDLHVPFPPFLKRMLYRNDEQGRGRTLTRVLEWNLRFCLMEYLFNQQGHVRKVFLKTKHRAVLIDGYVRFISRFDIIQEVDSLRRRFIFMGILNAIFAPFIVLYMIMYSFFRYFEVCCLVTFCARHITDALGCTRNTTRTRLRSVVDDTPLTQDGSSANLTNFITFLAVA